MAKSNLIYRGPHDRHPRTVSAKAVAAALSEVKQSRSRFRNLAGTRPSTQVQNVGTGEIEELSEE